MKLLCGANNLTIKKEKWGNCTGQKQQTRRGGLLLRD
jgi:hypothetical protein